MRASIPVRRRSLLVAASIWPLTGVVACGEAPGADRALVFGSLDDALRELDSLLQMSARTAGLWNLPQTLAHCAQSIEYSMTGFPQPNSALFQRTVGALAFSVFAWRGRMRHDLAETIPGAPQIDAATDPQRAAQRLREAVTRFRGNNDTLQPHFAYGALDKAQYEHAHAMHLANHFSLFGPAA